VSGFGSKVDAAPPAPKANLNGPIARIFMESLESFRHVIWAALPHGIKIAFHIEGEMGGEWLLCRDETLDVAPGTDRWPDCRLECSADDFLRLLSGSLEPEEAYLSGRINVQGDVGLILALRDAVVPAVV